MWLLDHPNPLDRHAHLADVQQRWRLEARALQVVLAESQAELEHWQREICLWRLSGQEPARTVMQRCELLQSYCDELAQELTHVQLALAGADEERRRDGNHLAQPA